MTCCAYRQLIDADDETSAVATHDVVRGKEAALRPVLSFTSPPSLINLFDVEDLCGESSASVTGHTKPMRTHLFSFDERHLVVLVDSIIVEHDSS